VSVDVTGLVKIVIDLPPESGSSAETLWARPTEGVFRLQNVPVWAYGVAFEDDVFAETGSDDRLHFVGLARAGGLLTVRVAGPDADTSKLNELLKAIGQIAVVRENFSECYAVFAVERERKREIDLLVESFDDDDQIFVEFANLPESDGPEGGSAQ